MGDNQRRPGKQPEYGEDTVKFYVSNFPDKCSGKDLDDLLKEFGEITKIYIARKRDREGRRFGFVTFGGVRDKADLERSMRNLWLGSFKLRINVARFVGEQGEARSTEDNRSKADDNRKKADTTKEQKGRQEQTAGGRRPGSFKEAVTGATKGTKEELLVDIPDIINEYSDRHGKALVARLLNVDKLKKIGQLARELNPSGGSIQFLGGLSVLLSFKDSKEAEEVRKKAAVRVDFFSSIETWEGQSLPLERVAWLKVQGIPLNLLCNTTLDMIGERFGKVIHKAKVQKDSGDLSYEYVGVLVGDGRRIMDEVILQWRRKRFRVWVMEEIGDWIPDFLFNNLEATRNKNPSEEVGTPSEHQNPPAKEGASDDINCNEKNLDTEDLMGNGFGNESSHNNGENEKSKVSKVMGDVIEEIKVDHGTEFNENKEIEDKIMEDGEIPVVGSIGKRDKKSFSCELTKKRKKLKIFKRSGSLTKSSSGPIKKKYKKKPISKDDPFDLERFIGPMEVSKVKIFKDKKGKVSKVQEEISGVNCTRVTGEHLMPFEDLLNEAAETNHCEVYSGQLFDLNARPDTTGSEFIVTEEAEGDFEVSKTIQLGVKLGADVVNREELVRNTVREEGLQGVKS